MTILKIKPSQMSDASAEAFKDKVMSKFRDVVMQKVTAPTTGCTATLLNEAGNLNGTYSYYVTFYTSDGETEASSISNEVILVNQKMTLSSIQTSTDPLVVGRKIYRNVSGVSDMVLKKLVATIADNTTTTYIDNIADGSLGVNVPQMGNTGGDLFIGSDRVAHLSDKSISVGKNSMLNNTGYANSSFGINSLTKNTTGFRNSAFGVFSLYEITTGTGNSAFGVHALNNVVVGTNNCAFGYGSAQTTTGSENASFGMQSLFNNVAGNYNTCFGTRALANGSGSNNVAIGFEAGLYETGNSKLYIDNARRASEADARLKAMIYGIFAAAPADQLITFNAVMRLTPQASAPTSNLSEGNIYCGTDHHIYYYNGSTWKQLDN